MTVLRTSRLAMTLVCLSLAVPALAQSAPGRLLVAPFEDLSRDASVHWLGEACAVLVANGLRSKGVAVVPRGERVRAYDELNVPLAATLSRATVIKIAELLGATELIAGSFKVEDGQFTVSASRIRLDAGRVQPPVSEHGPLTSLFDVTDRVVQRLAPGGASHPAGDRPPLGAFEHYVKGLVAESLATRATFLESAIQEFPAFDAARLALWDVRTEQGDHEAALAAVSSIDDEAPSGYAARFSAALSMMELSRFDEAFAAFSDLVTPQMPAVRRAAVNNNLGLIQMRRGGAPAGGTAEYFLTRAADDDPYDPSYRFNLGYAYALRRDQPAAIYWLRETLRRDPTDAEAHLVLASSLQATGATVEAGRERELAKQLSSEYEDDRAARGGVPRGLERPQREPDGSGVLRPGEIVTSSVQREQQETASFHLESGRRLFEREQDSQALAELRRAVYLSPYEAEAHLLMGRIFLRTGRLEDAIAALKISVWSTDSVAGRVALAEAYLKTGDTPAARAEVDRALALDPTSVEAQRVRGEIK